MIRNKKTTSKFISVLSAVIAVVMLGTTVFASGVLSDFATDDYTVEITNNGEKIELTNKPFVANDTVYLPLREMLNNEGIENEYITYNNGYAEFYIHSEKPIEYRNQLYDFWINRVRIDSVYVYIGGFSGGTTENDWMMRPAVLVDDTTYVPYELFEKLSDSGQGVFDKLSVMVKNDANLIGKGYINENLNFTIELPFSWNKKYVIAENENLISFFHKSTYDKYGSGEIFSIIKLDEIVYQKEPDAEDVWESVKRRVIMQSESSTYVMIIPGETQGQKWENYEEFKAMQEDADFIGKSILPIAVSDKGQPHDPTYTVTEFFSAFERGIFFIMENLCTEKCINTFFGDGYCFGMTTASIQAMEIDPLEYAKSSNDFNVFVTVNMTPHENSVFDPSQTEASFYVILQRQPDGRYLIDEFATGL